VDINIPYPSGMQEIIKKAFPYYKLEEAILTGKRYDAKEQEKHHVIIKACDNAEAVQQEAIAFAKTFKKKRSIFEEMKKGLNKHIIAVIDNEDSAYIEGLDIFKQ
jgi:enoyl-CoA hydratase/carnithine racemase